MSTVARNLIHSLLKSRRTSMMASLTVQHDEKAKKFYISLGSNEEAVLEYANQPDGCVDMYHTEVPVSMRGQGIAGILAKAALTHAVDKKWRVKLSCSYLQHYATKHSEFNSVIIGATG